MRSSFALLIVATTVFAQTNFTTGQLGDATQNFNNPPGAAYRAVVGDNEMGITGSITAVSAGDRGVEFAVEFDNLPTEGGPFPYHIHVAPVPGDGNCTSTLGHLDPFVRGETPACNPAQPATCQVGDLAGKYGKANGTSFKASYTDSYVSLSEGMGAYFGNRSFVLHFANTSRIACGNFSSLSDDEVSTMSMPPAGASSTSVGDNSAVATSLGGAGIPASQALSTSTTLNAASATGSNHASSTSSAAVAQETGNAASAVQAQMHLLPFAALAGLLALI